MEILLNQLPSEFYVNDRGNSIYELWLKGSEKSIFVRFPFVIDKDIARLYGMLYDGSLSKRLISILFAQKKDPNKAYEFAKIIYDKFGISSKITRRDDNTLTAVASSNALCHFLYSCLGFYKSDEDAKIPPWLNFVSDDIVKEYIRYAFAMEGSVSYSWIGKKEIRFHSTSLLLINQLQILFLKRYNLKFSICKYYIKNYGWKYFLFSSSRNNLILFSSLGFALESHTKRLNLLLENCKLTTKESVILAISYENENPIILVNFYEKYFNFIKKETLVKVLSYLRKQGLITNNGISLTSEGLKFLETIPKNIPIKRLQNPPYFVQEKVYDYIRKNGISYASEIARALSFDLRTVRDSLLRLKRKELILYSGKDHFGKKYYKINIWI